jgi:plastocyanin
MLQRITAPLALPFILATVALAVVASANARTSKESFDLKGEVYPSYKIEMVNSANRPLKTVKAGTHRIKIEDKAAIHDFHLVGPGINKRTSLTGIGEVIWSLKLKPGTYRYFCDPHASMMHGSFRVVA